MLVALDNQPHQIYHRVWYRLNHRRARFPKTSTIEEDTPSPAQTGTLCVICQLGGNLAIQTASEHSV